MIASSLLQNPLMGIIRNRLNGPDKGITNKSFLYPKKIGDYQFLRPFMEDKHTAHFYLACYKNSKGDLAFGKFWEGKSKNTSYYWLKNEILIYETLGKTKKKEGEKLDKIFPNIKTPDLIYSNSTDSSLTLLTEFVEGQQLKYFKPEIVKVIDFSKKYIEEVDKHTKGLNRQEFLVLSPITIALAFFYLFLVSLIKFPKMRTKILKGAFIFLSNLPKMLKSDLEFIHKDMAGNILVSKNKAYLIDFQVSAITLPELEAAAIAIYFWEKKEYFEKLKSLDMMKRIYGNNKNLNNYKALLVYSILFDMNFSKNLSEKSYSSILDYAINLKRY